MKRRPEHNRVTYSRPTKFAFLAVWVRDARGLSKCVHPVARLQIPPGDARMREVEEELLRKWPGGSCEWV